MVTSATATHFTALAPAESAGSDRTVDVTITTPMGGGSTPTAADQYSYE
jgi:hypothetical protein